ncbi:DUF1152 domain-containing protein [Candidatus Woesearchaeota archaeon]|nr:DUF1152 domain-containing protein [Candidatus Woesearchaeota archaeon]
MLNLPKKYNKALLIGTGGGNDIVSAILPALYLSKQGTQVDIAGILSPGATHTYRGKQEQVINKLEGDVKRFISSKKPTEISFVDSSLPQIAKELKIPVNNFYNLSTKQGSQELSVTVKKLVETNKYDLVLGVDVGGDILARGKEDSKLFSPMMDFTTLYILPCLNVDSFLLEFGLGTDGELESNGIREILTELRQKNLILNESEINKNDKEVSSFKIIYEKISKTRTGNTIPLTLKSLEHKGSDLIVEHKHTTRINNKKWELITEVRLLEETLGQAYLIDVKALVKNRQSTVLQHSNPLEQLIQLKKIPTWKTELDLNYLWGGNDLNWNGKSNGGFCLQALTPAFQLLEETRKEIVQEGYKQMQEGMSDAILVFNNDLKYLEKGKVEFRGGKFSILSNNENLEEEIAHTAEQISEHSVN